jgi:hypothetical protein
LQIDGGSENTAKTMLGICELLVAKGLTKKIILSRLPVGHTHEDIDAVFGKLWKYIGDKCVMTPQAYKRALEFALLNRNVQVQVEDIFCVPNYKEYMKSYIDTALARYMVLCVVLLDSFLINNWNIS